MDISNRRHLRAVTRDRLEKSGQVPKIALIYGGIAVGSSLVSTGLSLLMDHIANQYGGLSNLGTRAFLGTISTIFPFLIKFVLIALELGFLNAMLRVSRQQYASPQSLRLGFQRFWVLIRSLLLQTGLYFISAMASLYIASTVFVFSPFGMKMNQVIETYAGANATQEALLAAMENPVAAAAIQDASIPLLILFVLLFLLLSLPIAYAYRMTNFVIIDKPGIPALIAMSVSRNMMRHNFKKMFLVDLSLWWYYLAMILTTLLAYGDLILGACGVTLPMSPIAAALLFLGLHLLGTLVLVVFLRPYVSVTYSLAYDSLRPQEKPQEGAVLGNIFNM